MIGKPLENPTHAGPDVMTFEDLQVINYHWRRAIESLDEGLLLVRGDPERPESLAVLYANPAFCLRVGATLADLCDAPLARLVGSLSPDLWRELWNLTLRAPESSRTPVTFTSAGGPGAVEGRWKASPVFSGGASGETSFVLSVSWPARTPGLRIDPATADESAALEASREDTLSQIAGGIVHDMNNALTVIRGELESALENGGDADLSQAVRRAIQVTDSTTRLCRRLLNYSKGKPQGRTSCSLAELARESAEITGLGSNVCFHLDIPSDLPPVEGDRIELMQVLNNLLLNARQAMPDGGLVQVTARHQETPDGPGQLVLEVRDRGPGIPPDLCERIFEPLFTTKDDGNGLGLATCRRIVRDHGGSIEVESVPGRGATFRVRLPAGVALPAAPSPIRETGPAPPLPEVPERGAHILFVDDQEQINAIATRYLERLGHRVTSVTSGQEALERYRDAWRSRQPFDLVVIDMTLPGGLGGLDTFEELRALDPSVVCIAASGSFDESSRPALLAHGFAAMLAKPFPLQQLAEAVHEALARQPA